VRALSPRRYLAALALAAASVVALAWAYVALFPALYLDPEYGAWRAKERLLADCRLGQAVVVGNSRAAAGILPALLSVPATNLAVGGGEAIEALAAVRRALACPTPPRLVLIALGPGQFVQPDLFWERTVRYGFLNGAELAELASASRATGDFSVYDNGHGDGLPAALRAWLYRARFPGLSFASLTRGGLFLRAWANARTYRATLAARGQYFFGTAPGCDQVAVEGHLDAFRPLPVLDLYFDRLLALLAARGVAAAFVSMPLNDATEAAVKPEIGHAFAAYLHAYQQRYPGLRLIGAPLYGWPDALFGDAFAHLNPTGAALFSRRLARCLGPSGGACDLDWPGAAVQSAAPSAQEGA